MPYAIDRERVSCVFLPTTELSGKEEMDGCYRVTEDIGT